MAIIPQQRLFDWRQVEELGDLKRLKLVIENLPDEELMRVLEKERGKKGRNDYPVRAMWNALVAGIVFQHSSTESLKRELSRNAQMRYMCGFLGSKVPSSAAFTRLIKKLSKHQDKVDKVFEELVEQLRQLLPDTGKHLTIDSKAIRSFGKKAKKEGKDGRRDTDADYGQKVCKVRSKDGRIVEKVKKWFGYKLHLIADAKYELPLAYSVTKASVSDIAGAHNMIEHLSENRSRVLENAEILIGDRAYDDTALIKTCHDGHNIKTVIDIRDMWKDGSETRLLSGQKNVVYNYKGEVFCHCPVTNVRRPMVNGGYEKDRKTLKKLCPASQYGIKCKGYNQCPVSKGIRIPLSEDRRVFTAIDRSSYKWKRIYNQRSSIERINSRLDTSFGLEVHTVRGLQKMKTKCSITLCVMLAMAVGHIKENRMDKMRSLVVA